MAKLILQKDSTTNGFDWLTTETGTGAIVYQTSPSLVTPTLGVAVGTTFNGNTFTTGTYTLTGTAGKTLTFTNSLTLSGTDGSTLTIGSGGTLVYTSNTLAVMAATTSAQLAGVISDETGTGALVFANTPTLVTPALGAATATTINGVTINASSGILTLVNGSTLVTAGAFSLTLTTTAATNVTFPLTGTLATLAGAETFTNKTLTLPIVSSSLSLGTDIIGVTGVNHIFQSVDGTGATISYNVSILSGATVSANSGTANIRTGTVSTAGNSGQLNIVTGASSVLGDSGAVSMLTGNVVTGNSGAFTATTGSSTLGDTGSWTLSTGTATAGRSGSFVFSTGTATTVVGNILLRATTVMKTQVAPTTQNAAGTLTTTQILSGLITVTQATGATIAITLPTGVDLEAALYNLIITGDSLEFTLINLSAAAADTATLTASVGITIVGKPIIDSANAAAVYPSSGTFRLRRSAAATFVAYRIS